MACGKEVFIPQHIIRAHRHELDEAEQRAFAVCVLNQGGDLTLSLVFHQHAVETDGVDACGECCIHTLKHARQEITIRGTLVGGLVKRVEGDVHGAYASADEVLGQGEATLLPGEQGAVGGDAYMVDAGNGGDLCAKIRHTWAGEGLASCDAHFVDAKPGTDTQHAHHFFKAEHLLLGEPSLLLLGHAVAAALIAPVGHGDAQVGDAMAEGVFHDG